MKNETGILLGAYSNPLDFKTLITLTAQIWCFLLFCKGTFLTNRSRNMLFSQWCDWSLNLKECAPWNENMDTWPSGQLPTKFCITGLPNRFLSPRLKEEELIFRIPKQSCPSGLTGLPPTQRSFQSCDCEASVGSSFLQKDELSGVTQMQNLGLRVESAPLHIVSGPIVKVHHCSTEHITAPKVTLSGSQFGPELFHMCKFLLVL